MNEMTEAGAKAKGGAKAKAGGGKGGKAAGANKVGSGGGEISAENQVARLLVRAIWAQEWSAANPDAKPEDRRAAWVDARSAAIERNIKVYRRALASLKRSGVMISITPVAVGSAVQEDAGEDA